MTSIQNLSAINGGAREFSIVVGIVTIHSKPLSIDETYQRSPLNMAARAHF